MSDLKYTPEIYENLYQIILGRIHNLFDEIILWMKYG